MLARARTSHNLTLVLAMLLAGPANLSMIARDIVATLEAAEGNLPGPAGACFHRAGHLGDVDPGDWSLVSDNVEGADGLDVFRYAPLAIPHRPTDLPSLVPCALEARPPLPTDRGTSFILSPPLRC